MANNTEKKVFIFVGIISLSALIILTALFILNNEEEPIPEIPVIIEEEPEDEVTIGGGGGGGGGGSQCSPAQGDPTSVGFTPILDLGTGIYDDGFGVKNYTGGLYGDGSNSPNSSYLTYGLEKAGQITRLNTSGGVDTQGRIGVISIGLSNTNQI